MKIDPIIGVADVEISSRWYQDIFGCSSKHGGATFDVLVDENKIVLICLHKWGEHDHPTLQGPKPKPGNGLILYFRIKNFETVLRNLKHIGHPLETDIQTNPNSGQREFSLLDPDGYYIIVTEYHNF